MRRDRVRDEAGSAAVEFVALTLVLLLPILYVVVTLSRVQAGAYAAEAAAYAAARAAVVAGLDALDAGASSGDAVDDARVAAAAAAALTAQDFRVDQTVVELACEGTCLDPGSVVRARVTVVVGLPGVPAALRAAVPAEVALDATASSPVDGYAP